MTNEKKKKATSYKECFAKTNKFQKGFIAVAGIVIVVILLVAFFWGSGKTEIQVETALKEMIKASDVSTAEYTYNSIAEIKNEKEIECYVSYEGKVKMGFDLEQVQVISEKNKLYVIIPEIKVTTVEVGEKLDYLFTKSKYDKEGYYAKAHATCYGDLVNKAKQNQAMTELTIENAIETMKGLTEPLQNMLKDGIELEVVYYKNVDLGARV